MATRTAATSTICAQFHDTAQRHADDVALRMHDGREWTWREYELDVRSAAVGLAGLDLQRGDVLACWLKNRPEFHIVDAAAMHLGVTSFSIHTSFTVDQATHVVADAGARVLVTEHAFIERALQIRNGRRTSLEYVVLVDAMEATSWEELIEGAPQDLDVDDAFSAVRGHDIVTLIYSAVASRGVELTHAGVISRARTLSDRLGLPEGIRTVSLLPMAHLGERLCSHYFPMFQGWQVTCCPDPRAVPGTLLDVRPGFLLSPPRLWEQLRAGVLAALEGAGRAGLHAALERVRAGEGPQDGPAQRELRASVGLDQLTVAIVGGAPCPTEVVEFWHACGVVLSEIPVDVAQGSRNTFVRT